MWRKVMKQYCNEQWFVAETANLETADFFATLNAEDLQPSLRSSGLDKAFVLLFGTIDVFRSSQHARVNKERQLSCIPCIGCSQWQVILQMCDALQVLFDLMQLRKSHLGHPFRTTQPRPSHAFLKPLGYWDYHRGRQVDLIFPLCLLQSRFCHG